MKSNIVANVVLKCYREEIINFRIFIYIYMYIIKSFNISGRGEK